MDITSWILQFLSVVPGVQNSVTHLGFSRSMTAQNVELMRACPNLRKVDMTISDVEL